MANRQALRDLQTRLAERLQAARTNAAAGAQWLAVQMGGRNYLLPLAQSGEIFSWTSVQRVPYTQAWFLGVANLRGNLVGVVDASALLGHAPQRAEHSLGEMSLVLLNPALQVNAALVVDRLLGLRGAQDFGAAAHAPTVSAPADTTPLALALQGPSYTDRAGLQWQVLSLQHLAQSPEFLSIRV